MTSRSITGLVLAALLVVPAAAQAQARRGSGGSGIWLGGQFGAELGDADGYQLRFDVEVPITRLTPRVQVAGVGSLSYSGLNTTQRAGAGSGGAPQLVRHAGFRHVR